MSTEGINGVLPNQDLLNAVLNIARWTGGIPVQYHSETDLLYSPTLPDWLVARLPDALLLHYVQPLLDHPRVQRYTRGFHHLRRHFGFAVTGSPAGGHGTFARYRIEGVTLFAEPATGPHGFLSLGM